VQPLPGHLPAPARRLRARRRQRAEGTPAEEAVASVLDIPLGPGLVLRVRHAGRVDQEPVVPRQLAVGAIGPRVVAVGVGNPGGEVVQHDAPGHAAQEGDGGDMALEPGGTVLGDDRIEELVPAMAERQEEGVELAPPGGLRIIPQPEVEEVDLGLLARRRVGPVRGHIAVEGPPARRQPALVAQLLVQHAQVDLPDPLLQVGVMLVDRGNDRPRCPLSRDAASPRMTTIRAAPLPSIGGAAWPRIARIGGDAADVRESAGQSPRRGSVRTPC
jgi:hypothetical protein